MKILHITTNDKWQEAVASGEYRADSLDTEGFIHCSTVSQVVKVANAFYRGQTDPIVLCIDIDKLIPEVKWEPPAHPNKKNAPADEKGELFPHVYGAINIDAVASIVGLRANNNGLFSLEDSR